MRLIDADTLLDRFPTGKPISTAKIKRTIKHQPTIDALPLIHAHWVFNHFYGRAYHCSNCGWGVDRESIFCPCCGAKMDSKKQEAAHSFSYRKFVVLWNSTHQKYETDYEKKTFEFETAQDALDAINDWYEDEEV